MDLEFNSPTNELLSIGVVNEYGREFHTYIYPGRRVNPYITRITGITDYMVKRAPNAENAFEMLYNYMMSMSKEDEFYFYGSSDKEVLKLLLFRMPTKHYINKVGNHIINNYVDYSENVKKHFQVIQTISLQKVFNYYFPDMIGIQAHDALEDAMMLKDIYHNIQWDRRDGLDRSKEFPEYKTNHNIQHKVNRLTKEGKFIEEYDSLRDASNWLIDNYLKNSTKNIKSINKNNVSKKISTAFKTNTAYVGYLWEIV